MATAKRWLNSSGNWVSSAAYFYDNTTGSNSDWAKNRTYIQVIAYDNQTITFKIHNNAVRGESQLGSIATYSAAAMVLRKNNSSGTQLASKTWDAATTGYGDITQDITSQGNTFWVTWNTTAVLIWGTNYNYGASNYGTKTVSFVTPFHTITYNANGGSGAPSTQNVYVGSNSLSTVEPTRSGYEFLGWATSASATSAEYSPGNTINIGNSNVVLYAVWKGLASQIASSSSSVQTTGNYGMTVTSFNASYYQKVVFKKGSTTLATTSAFQNSLTYTVPRSWFSSYPNDSSLTITAELYTYTNSSCTTQVGSAASTTFTVTCDNGMKPQLATGAITLAPYNTGTGAAYLTDNLYVQGFSKVKATVDTTKITFGSGASYASVSIKAENITSNSTGSSVTSSNKLANPGSQNVTYTITDSRGLSTTGTISITVNAYSKPVITVLRCERTDDQMDPDDTGGYFTVKAIASITSISSNTYDLTVCWMEAGGSYNTPSVFSPNTDTRRGNNTLDPDVTYTVKITATDTLLSVTEITVELPARTWPFHMIKDGAGFGDVVLEHGKVKIEEGMTLWIGSEKIAPLAATDESVDDVSLTANTYATIDVPISKTGYSPLGIVGWAIDNATNGGQYHTYVFPMRIAFSSSSNVRLWVRNTYTSTAKVKVTVRVLWARD